MVWVTECFEMGLGDKLVVFILGGCLLITNMADTTNVLLLRFQ
jgi:hypothetical protein